MKLIGSGDRGIQKQKWKKNFEVNDADFY